MRLFRREANPLFLSMLAVVVMSASWRILWVLTASAEQLVRILPDDAFYYFQVARNLAAGYGSTFDGSGITNGYHPLWLVAIWPFASIPSSLTIVRAALIVAVLLEGISAVLIYRILRLSSQSRLIAVIGTCVYSLSLTYWSSSLNGLETSLATCLFLFATLHGIEFEGLSNRRWVTLGLLLGALFLARTDNIFYVIVFAAYAGFKSWRKKQLAPAIGLVGVLGLVISPWLIWNWATFGSPVQTSGQAVPYVLHENFRLAGHTASEQLALSLNYFLTMLFGSYYWLAGLGSLVVAWYNQKIRNPELRRFTSLAAGLWLAGCVLIFVHTFVRWYPRTWYFDQLSVLNLLVVCNLLATVIRTPVIERFARHIRPLSVTARQLYSIAATVMIVGIGARVIEQNSSWLSEGVYPYQVESLDAAKWLTSHTNAEETAAAFDAGILAYFSERRVINLDGAISTSAYLALQEKCLLCYMKAANATYFVDYDPIMRQYYDLFFGHLSVDWQPIAVQDRPGVDFQQSVVRVYQLHWRPD